MKSFFAITIFLFAFLATLAQAIVWNPEIITPNAGTRWRAGETYTVQWKTDVAGEAIPDNVKGAIKLGYLEDGSIDEHLRWDLASGFNLNSGAQSITLPNDLDTKVSYIIVVMGDSGNASAKFTIKATRSA